MGSRILVIDDDRDILETLREILEFEGYQVDLAESGEAGLKRVDEGGIDLVLCDVKMARMDGMEVLRRLQAEHSDIPVIMISGHGTIETAVEAVKLGAFDFIEKPPDLNRLLITVRNALEKHTLVRETKKLRKKVKGLQPIIGESKAIQRIREMIERIAPLDTRVLITGESGVGKELVARWIHELSSRSRGPFVEVNCAAIPSELIESELFGHEKGAFTSAIKQRIGKFEEASGGTLFLDEIGDMSLSAQAKVLRALQENRITRVGSNKPIEVDVRVVSATNKNLIEAYQKGEFREDLYHRIATVIIHVPPLRERPEDIPLLVNHFLAEICEKYHFPPKEVTPEVMERLKQLPWTGNVRELHNVVERLAIFSDRIIDEKIFEQHVLGLIPRQETLESLFLKHDDLGAFKDEMERRFIEYKLRQHNWNISKTAEALNIQRSYLHVKMEKLGIHRPESENVIDKEG